MIHLTRLRKLGWLSALTNAEAELFAKEAHARELSPGALVFSPTRDPRCVYFLERGLVRIFRLSASGGEVSFGYVHPGEVFGELTAFSDKPRESFAQAIRPSVAWSVPREVFVKVIKSNPLVLFEVARQVEGRFKRIESRVEDFALRDARSRLVHVLLQLSDEFGEPEGEGISIDFPFTQSDLAALIGTTRQTVSEIVRELADRGLITRAGRRLRLLRPNGLLRSMQRVGGEDGAS